MAQAAILSSQRAAKTRGYAETCFARAAQARRIALMLTGQDASLLEAYAAECEAEAARPAGRPAIAA
jgi:hypothetical protein